MGEDKGGCDVHEEVLPCREEDEGNEDHGADLKGEQFFVSFLVEFEEVGEEEAGDAAEEICVAEVLSEDEGGEGAFVEAVLDEFGLEEDLGWVQLTFRSILETPITASTSG